MWWMASCSSSAGTTTAIAFNQISSGYTDPDNPNLDAGYCDQDRKHLASLNMGYQTPNANNGVVLGNPRLGFVCTGQTVDGQLAVRGFLASVSTGALTSSA